MKAIYTLVFLLAYLNGIGQNKVNIHGLKYGHWHENDVDCFYKIIPFSFYDTIRFDGDDRLEINRYKGKDTTHETIRISGFYGDSISVIDGILKAFDSLGKISQIIEYRNGLIGNMIDFSNGDTIAFHHSFIENIDKNYYDYYLNNRVVMRRLYKKDQLTYLYYPNDDLIISNAKPFSKINLNNSQIDTINIPISANRDVIIDSIDHFSNLTLLVNKTGRISFPLTIKKGESYNLNIVNHQQPDTIIESETITIHTRNDNKSYDIYLTTAASHISEENVQNIKKLTLSRSKDKYLIIFSCGPYGHWNISNNGTIVTEYGYEYAPDKMYKIPLQNLPLKHYQVEIRMCYDDGYGIGTVFDLYLKE